MGQFCYILKGIIMFSDSVYVTLLKDTVVYAI